MLNSYPYLIVLTIYFILFYLESRRIISRQKVRYFCISIFIFFFGFRGYVGSDWYNYSIAYDYINNAIAYQSQAELGFQILIQICKSVGMGYFTFVFFITTIQAFLLDKILNNFSVYICFPYIVLISLFPTLIIDLLRNFTAILLVFNGLIYLEKGRSKYFFLFIFLGFLFHSSVLVFISCLFFKKKLMSKRIMILLFLVGVVVYFLQINFYSTFSQVIGSAVGGRLGYLISYTVANDDISYGIRFGILEKIFLFIIVIYNYELFRTRFSPVLVNMFILYLVVNLFFSTSQAMIHRFSLLFALAYCIVMANYFYLINNKRYFKALAFVFCLFLYGRTFITFSPDIYNYKNILFQKDNYNDRINARAKHYSEEVEIF